MKHKPTVKELFESKPYELVVVTRNAVESFVNQASHIGCLVEDLAAAIRSAKRLTADDGRTRRVEIRHIVRSIEINA